MNIFRRVRASQLYGEPSAIAYIRSNLDLENLVIVSPDAGGAKR
jgi:ribose-phosphate pyrophosphokinase